MADSETKEDVARDIADMVPGVDPTFHEESVYFDQADLSELKRWIADNDPNLPKE